ncbi:MAG: FAD-dependent monooxygenase [Spirochaetes bacterium]|nr:FAD-dependent monooxygenase [Spirochaetota bacterium]MBN2771505.1 FAD-dependent monooxygenase [Spirochaetota bacterium]
MIKRIQIQMPPDYSQDNLSKVVAEISNIKRPFFSIVSRSLDARKAGNIHYCINIDVSPNPLPAGDCLKIPLVNKNISAIVVGFGPAGYFAALVLSRAGISVTVLEKGKKVCERENDILHFENSGSLVENSNYLFGEGGAGTFSDGKLTSRSKRISLEKEFILKTYIEAGADEEIEFDAHPHLGSDRLREMMPELRKILLRQNVQILFETEFKSFTKKNNRFSIETSKGTIESDLLFIAPGHSSYNTYRSLIRSNVQFRTKPFAVGFRVEHPRALINRAQWKRDSLPGIRSAEYRLSYINGDARVYSFCMCPGGNIVPAAVSQGHSAVNGASNYARDGKYSNAAIVSAFTLESRLKKTVLPLEVLDYVEEQTSMLFNCTKSYNMPAVTISDFLKNRVSSVLPECSYPFEIFPYDYNMIFDNRLCSDLKEGLTYFCNKINGFEQGIIVGSEYTTSAPIQCFRDKEGEVEGVEKLYICGEGSGFAGGIISSAADGVRLAMNAVCKMSG